ncbi:unnamed protein product, partial [Meganyctiphanes norvegica]
VIPLIRSEFRILLCFATYLDLCISSSAILGVVEAELLSNLITMSAAPQLRGLLNKQIGRHLWVAIGLSVATAAGWKYGVCEPRKAVYANYYKDFDAQADFDRMRNLGLFQSCKPDGEEE